MNTLILGGNGFLGTNLTHALAAAGHRVTVFDRPGSSPFKPFPPQVEFVGGQFSSRDSVERALDGIDAVFHLISTSLPKTSNEDPVYDLETNLVDTVRFLEAARGRGVRRIIFPSSGGTVYGIPRETPIKESHPTDPLCSYGIGKLAIEKYLQLFERLHGLSYRVLRISNAYGAGQSPGNIQGAVAVFADKMLRGEAITVWGDGSAVRDYIHVDDVMSAFKQVLAHEGEQRVFNIGSGSGRSVVELMDAIESVGKRPLKRNFIAARPLDVPANVLDISRARRYLGWEPKVPLLEGLARTMEWLTARHAA